MLGRGYQPNSTGGFSKRALIHLLKGIFEFRFGDEVNSGTKFLASFSKPLDRVQNSFYCRSIVLADFKDYY